MLVNDVCQDAIERLSGWPNGINGDKVIRVIRN